MIRWGIQGRGAEGLDQPDTDEAEGPPPLRRWGLRGLFVLGCVLALAACNPHTGTTAASAGGGFSCAVQDDGTVTCWGDNSNGQLGDGTRASTTAPVRVVGLTNAVAVSAGTGHACAVLDDGTARCWGTNTYWQLGSGVSGGQSTTPVAVVGLAGVTSITAGGDHTCATVSDGTARCWGDSLRGQLGIGVQQPRPTPVEVPGLTGVTSLDADLNTTCATIDDGTARCWGANDHGQLGDGTTTRSLSPVTVTGLTDATGVAVGPDHTCATIDDGTARCWGANSRGQLGNGTTPGATAPGSLPDSPTPVAVTGLTSATTISAGVSHTCATLTDGTARCWGGNDRGQLGLGGADDLGHATPASVPGLSGATGLSAGDSHTCATVTGSTTRCWGSNTSGGLGIGGTVDTPSPSTVQKPQVLGAIAEISGGGDHSCTRYRSGAVSCVGANRAGSLGNANGNSTTPVLVSGVTGATSISAGRSHTCATISDGTARCWGGNSGGRLGDGTTTNSSTPVTVTGLTGAASTAVGANHSCAMIDDGTVRCWGDNTYAQLGNGTIGGASSTPVTVDGLTGVTSITAGASFTCATITDGTVRCWGMNDFGTLGDGTTDPRPSPVTVTGLTGVTDIGAGVSHACATLADGTARCWGRNAAGQLGNGAVEEVAHPTPTPVLGLTGARTITAGAGQTCATLTDGTARCWGANNQGQLGDGTTTARPTPVTVTGLDGAASIESGDNHTCAVRTDGTARCWGRNTFGQLSTGTTIDALTPTAVLLRR